MRGVPLRQGGRRDRCETDRLADEPASGLFKDQCEFSEAKTETIGGRRNKDAEPAEVAGLSQPLGRKSRIAVAKPAGDFRTGSGNEFRGAVAQQNLLWRQAK